MIAEEINWEQDQSILRRSILLCREGNLKSCDILLVWTKTFPKEELIIGGMGDGRKDHEFNRDQLVRGIGVELEHTDDPWQAKEIVKDHLIEEAEVKQISPKFSVYYDDLKKMEDAWKIKYKKRKLFTKSIFR